MVQVNRITGGSEEFVRLLQDIKDRVSSLETRGTGPIFVSDQITTADPNTGVETVFGALPNGEYGLQQYVNDTTPPDKPSTPTVIGQNSIYEIVWDGLDFNGLDQPSDYSRTVVEMSDTADSGVWSEVSYFNAAGRVVVGNQTSNATKYFRLVSIDANGNRSVPSDTVSSTLIPYMESAEMTEWIGGIEQSVVDAETAATNAQTAATEAQNTADNLLSGLADHVPYGDLELPGLDKYNGTISLKSASSLAHSGSVYAEGIISTTVDRTMVLPDIMCTPGRTYRMSFWMWMSADVTGHAGMPNMWAASGSGATVNSGWPPLYYRMHRPNQVVGSWFKVEGDIVAPEGVSHIRPRFYLWKASAPEGTIVRFDDFSVLDITEAQSALDAAAVASEDARLAAEAAGLAQDAADGKSTVWYLDTPPAGTTHKQGDLWFDEANGNEPKTWDTALQDWVSARDATIAAADAKAESASAVASTAESNALAAQNAAEEAEKNINILMSSADSLVIGGDFEQDLDFYSGYRTTVADTYSGSWVLGIPTDQQYNIYFPKVNVRPGAVLRSTMVAREYPSVDTDVVPFVGLRIFHSDSSVTYMYRNVVEESPVTATWQQYIFDFDELPSSAVAIQPRLYTYSVTDTFPGTSTIFIDRIDMVDMSQHKTALQAAADARAIADQALQDAFDANEAAGLAQQSASGKNYIKYDTVAGPPALNGIAVGDTYYQMSSTADAGRTIGMWRWDGTTWKSHKVDGLTIANVDAGTITAGYLSSSRINANSITADKLLIGNGSNLQLDSEMLDPNVWPGTRLQAKGTGKTGNGSYLIESGTTQRGWYTGGIDNPIYRVPVVAGAKYRVGSWLLTSAIASPGSIVIYVRVYNSADNTFSFATPTNITSATSISAGTWTKLSGIVTVPEGYDRMVIGLYSQATYTGAARFSDPFIQQAVGNTLIDGGSITADKMVSGTITAESGIIGSIDASKITVGEMNASRIKAGSITADRLVIGTGDNLIVDANFPAPVSPTATSAGNITARRIADSSAGVTWLAPNRLGWNQNTTYSGQMVLCMGNSITNASEQTIPIVPGRKYVVRWRVYSDAIGGIGTRPAVRYTFADGTTGYYALGTAAYHPIENTGLSREFIEEFIPRDNAVKMSFDLQTNGHHGAGRLDFLRPQVQLMTDGTVITEDAVTTKHIRAGAITGDVIDVNYVVTNIAEANLFAGKTFTGGTFQYATFQTTLLSNRGLKMSPDYGFISYDSNGNVTFQADTNGNVTLKGSLQVGSTVPTDSVIGLSTSKLAGYDATTSKVDYWTSTDDVTLIDGGTIATDSITADKISLGDATHNLITGGYGEDSTGWIDQFSSFVYRPASYYTYMPNGEPGAYQLTNAKPGSGRSANFSVVGLKTFNFRYSVLNIGNLVPIRVRLAFFDVNDASLGELPTIVATPPSAGTWYLYNYDNLTPPAGATSCRLWVEPVSPPPVYDASFTRFEIIAGAKSELTAEGFYSYQGDTQTVRLTGESNMMVGEFVTGIAGAMPYTRLSSRDNITAIDMWGPNDTAQHGGLWWEHDRQSIRGVMSLFAMAGTNLNVNSDPGMKFHTMSGARDSGTIDYYGRIGADSQTFKVGRMSWGNLGAKDSTTLVNYITKQQINFLTPYPAGVLPDVFLQAKTVNAAEVICTVSDVTNTGFKATIVNHAPRETGTLWVSYLAVKGLNNSQ